MIFQMISFGIVGAIAGILSGLLGIGGGIVTIPCLVLIFSYIGLPPHHIMHLAIGTSLAAMVFNTISGSYTHYKKQAIVFTVIKPMALGVVVGAALGALIATLLSSHFLQIFFGVFEILLGIRFLFPESKTERGHSIPSFGVLSLISTAVTTLSTMLGIGGGMVNVPILTHFGIPVKKAIGTSSALSFLISFCGAILFLLFGMHHTTIPSTMGYIYIPAFLFISVVSFCVAPYGAHLAHRLPTAILKKVFAIVLIAAGLSMIL
ncbi:MAG: sulfite exporter TauE/SafE family protein [Chlamydiia bacterium]|nr:sulfite exporter TauE/SafE family protein [Chlamydiia bacterium]